MKALSSMGAEQKLDAILLQHICLPLFPVLCVRLISLILLLPLLTMSFLHSFNHVYMPGLMILTYRIIVLTWMSHCCHQSILVQTFCHCNQCSLLTPFEVIYFPSHHCPLMMNYLLYQSMNLVWYIGLCMLWICISVKHNFLPLNSILLSNLFRIPCHMAIWMVVLKPVQLIDWTICSIIALTQLSLLH